jgi:DNA-binding NtrC family response regulator
MAGNTSLIIIIDDNEYVSVAIEMILQDMGYNNVMTFLSMDNALTEIKTKPPVLIIVDYYVLGEDVFSTIDSIKKFCPQSTIIITNDSCNSNKTLKENFHFIEKNINFGKSLYVYLSDILSDKIKS